MGTYLWACPLTPIPQPHLPSLCFCEIKVRGSKKMVLPAILSSLCFSVMSLCV